VRGAVGTGEPAERCAKCKSRSAPPSPHWATEAGYRGIQFNAVVENNRAAVALWQSLDFEIIGTVPGAFRHADGSYVGLHVIFRRIG
jgi:hypothetical protein